MNLLLLLVLAIPVGCLALLSLVAFLGVMALAGALRMVGAIYSGLGLGSADGNQTRGTARSVMLTRSTMLRLSATRH